MSMNEIVNERELICMLQAKQSEKGMSDSRFARLLGISPSLWSMIQSGHRGMGERTYAGIVRNFPDLHDCVLAALRGE